MVGLELGPQPRVVLLDLLARDAEGLGHPRSIRDGARGEDPERTRPVEVPGSIRRARADPATRRSLDPENDAVCGVVSGSHLIFLRRLRGGAGWRIPRSELSVVPAVGAALADDSPPRETAVTSSQ